MIVALRWKLFRLFRRDAVKIDYRKAEFLLYHVMILKSVREDWNTDRSNGRWWRLDRGNGSACLIGCLIINQFNLVGLLSGETLRRAFIQFSLGWFTLRLSSNDKTAFVRQNLSEMRVSYFVRCWIRCVFTESRLDNWGKVRECKKPEGDWAISVPSQVIGE